LALSIFGFSRLARAYYSLFMKAISIKLPDPLFHDLAQRARSSASSQSEIIRAFSGAAEQKRQASRVGAAATSRNCASHDYLRGSAGGGYILTRALPGARAALIEMVGEGFLAIGMSLAEHHSAIPCRK
jgi:hypothetical protein